jgi:phosphonate transport system substrate-binding protein
MIMKTLSKGLIISSFILCCLVGMLQAVKPGNQVNIAITPCFDNIMAYKKFHPLITYLEKQTGFKINLFVPKDMTELESAIHNRNVDFVLQDPHMYIKFEKFFSKDSLLSSLNRSGGTLQHGVFITRKGSGINNITDLKGKTMMFGPKLSSVKWLSAKVLLRENGINIDKDLKSYSHGVCCEDIAFNVFLGGVDAGVICEHFLEEHPQKQKELGIDPKQIVVIGKTKPVATRILAAHKATPADIVAKINQALLRLDRKNPEHAKILYPAELGGFQKTKDQDYNK